MIHLVEEPKRWSYRYASFKRAVNLIEKGLKVPNPSELEQAGLVHFFEISLELAWKLMKDYLEAQGNEKLMGPSQVIQLAFQRGIIDNGHEWMEALKDRNLTTHVYDQEIASQLVDKIQDIHLPLFKSLLDYLNPLLPK